MLAVRLPEAIEHRLEALAKATGRTKTYYVREAIVEHIDDLEDATWPSSACSTFERVVRPRSRSKT